MSGKIECVYFVHAEDTDLVKIGRTSDLAKRFDQLQTASPHRLRLLGVHLGSPDVSVSDIETIYHADLAPYRHRGEWFLFTREMRRWLRAGLEQHFESRFATRSFHFDRIRSEDDAKDHQEWQAKIESFIGVPGSQPSVVGAFDTDLMDLMDEQGGSNE